MSVRSYSHRLSLCTTAALILPLLTAAARPLTPASPAVAAGQVANGPIETSSKPTPNGVLAGYSASVHDGSATSAAARYVLPRLKCTAAFRAITPVAGISVDTPTATYSAAFIVTACVNGKARYNAGLVINGHEPDDSHISLHPGNVIRVSTNVTNKTTKVAVTNTTTGVTTARHGNGARAYSVYIGDSDWTLKGRTVGVPVFRTITFTKCDVDGKPVGNFAPTEYERSYRGVLEIATSSLISAGSSFHTYFRHP